MRRHSSPSIASNYAVLVSSGSLLLERCSLMSATGSALGVEGGRASAIKCRRAALVSLFCISRASLNGPNCHDSECLRTEQNR